MDLKQIIKKAYIDGIIEGQVIAKVNLNFDTDGMSEHYAETELKKLRVGDVIKSEASVCKHETMLVNDDFNTHYCKKCRLWNYPLQTVL